jgi:hypothetical protein
MATTEKRAFKMHPALFYSVVLRQAGSLTKALLELVMNSVDAKAKKCQIMIDDDKISVKDDGQGFRQRSDIEDFFEVFGQPHGEEEEKTYGQFRIGRGQAFAYGVNHWRSGAFSMDVDVKNKGMDYDLRDSLEPHPGCEIKMELYEKLLPSQLEEVQHTLARWVQYAPITVRINGKKVNKNLADLKWDAETDDAYIRFHGADGFEVYNLGIFVLSLPRYQFGGGGTVVSKQQLKVNFARNDIQSDCPVWKRVKPLLDQRSTETLTKKKVLDDDGRKALIQQIIRKRLPIGPDEAKLRLLTAVTGRVYPLSELYGSHTCLSAATKGELKATRVHESKRAFVLARSTLDQFDVLSCESLQQLLNDRKDDSMRYCEFDALKVVPIEKLTKGMTNKHDIIPDKEWLPREQLWLGLIEQAAGQSFPEGRERKYLIGRSETARGWTDALTYVAINRNYLKKHELTIEGFNSVGSLLIHELCHLENDTVEHEHDLEFYQKFHDRVLQGELGAFVDKCLRLLPRVSAQLDRRLAKRQLYEQDKVMLAERAVESSKAVAASSS